MRGRWLFVVSLVAITVLVGIAGVVALRGDGSAKVPDGSIAVDVSDLHPGDVMPVDVTLPGAKHKKARVFLVRRDDKQVLALLGVSTHLGCRLWWPGDPRFGEGFTMSARVEYEDPCGGSVFATDGACIGGPCPRGLDRYPVTVDGDTVEQVAVEWAIATSTDTCSWCLLLG